MDKRQTSKRSPIGSTSFARHKGKLTSRGAGDLSPCSRKPERHSKPPFVAFSGFKISEIPTQETEMTKNT